MDGRCCAKKFYHFAQVQDVMFVIIPLIFAYYHIFRFCSLSECKQSPVTSTATARFSIGVVDLISIWRDSNIFSNVMSSNLLLPSAENNSSQCLVSFAQVMLRGKIHPSRHDGRELRCGCGCDCAGGCVLRRDDQASNE